MDISSLLGTSSSSSAYGASGSSSSSSETSETDETSLLEEILEEMEEASDSEDYPYAMQILQGTDYKHDYVMTQADSEDTTNETITNTPSSGSGSTSMISAAYAAQIQAVQNQGAADLLSAGASNLSSLTSDDDGNSLANSLFSSLISSSNG